MVECGSEMEISLRWSAVAGRTDVMGVLEWTLKVVNVSRKPFGSLNTCHHPGAGQNFTTTVCIACADNLYKATFS